MANVPARVHYRNNAEGTPDVVTSVPVSRDVSVLATAAARLLFQAVDRCAFLLYSGEGGTFIQAITADATAHVGPFRGPAIPPSLSRVFGLPLNDLLAHLNIATGPHDYVVHIEYRDTPRKPRRSQRRSESERAAEMAEYESALQRIAERPSVKRVYFPVAPGDWRAADFDALLGRVYAALPEHDGLWNITLTGENYKPSHPKNVGFSLTFMASGFTATLKLPAFPTDAIADWLESRKFDLKLEVSEATIRRAALAVVTERVGA